MQDPGVMLVPLILNIPEFQICQMFFCFFKKRLVSDAVLQVTVIAKLKNNVRVANSAKPMPFFVFSQIISQCCLVKLKHCEL